MLVGEAAALADTHGLAFVTLANLAERLNVRVPSLYNHIESADDLQHQLSLFALQGLADAITRAAIGKNGPEGLLAIANAYRAFAKAHPGMYLATLRAPRPNDEAMLAITGAVLDVLYAVMAPFNLDGDPLIHAIRGFRSVVHGFVSLEAAGGFGFKQTTDESLQFILLLFISGLSTHRPGSQ
jgi:AcrR family transcriptional regulator